MTVNELIDELLDIKEMGRGDNPVFLMNLNTQEHEEAENVELFGTRDIEIR